MPRNEDQFVLDEEEENGYFLVGMGVKMTEPEEWALCYLFEHQDGGTEELPPYYIREMGCIPSDFEEVSEGAREAAERHKVPYYGKLPEGCSSGDEPIWEDNLEGLDEEPEVSEISAARRTAEIAFQFYTNRRKGRATEALTVLLMQLQSLFGHSEAFFSLFPLLDKVKRAIEQDDFENGTAPLLAILVRLRQVEAILEKEEE